MTQEELKIFDEKVNEANDIARKIKGFESFLRLFDDKSDVLVEINQHCFPVCGYDLFVPYGKEEKEMLQTMCFSFLKTHFESKLEKLKEKFSKMEVKFETNF